ncbi:MAG: AI-2E family transporter [Desulfobulbaceae bacterium]|nr:AI-2E family transporter [Desulfobulbaceae bacterium]
MARIIRPNSKKSGINRCISRTRLASHYPENLEKNHLQLNPNYFLFFLIIIVLIGCYNIIHPYLHTIVLAFILATIFNPLHRKVERFFKGKKNRAALISCIFITLVVVMPLFFMLLALIQQGVESFNAIYHWVDSGAYQNVINHPLVDNISSRLGEYLPDLRKNFPNIDIKSINFEKVALNTSEAIGKLLLDQGGNLASNLTAFVGKFFLMLFAFFFFVRDEEKIIDAVLHLIPLSSSQEYKIIFKINAVAKSALLGTVVTALAQGLAGGIAFYICGLPGFFWGMAMAFASLIPLIGTSLIWAPAALYLLAAGHWGYAIFMVLWCVIVVGMIDNFLRPYFMQDAADMSTFLIFFAILGGINYFGLIGLLYGPLIFGLLMVLLYIYKIEFDDFLTKQDQC